MSPSESAPLVKSLPPWLSRELKKLQGFGGQALLLHGPSGLGHFELASALAQLWLCESPAQGQACGHCASCQNWSAHTHAETMVLMPETECLARNWPLSEAAQAELDGKKRKPSKEIRVDAVRDVVQFSQRTSGTVRGKVVVVYPAEQMNAVSANTLLKTLEEPPGNLRFILATTSIHQLLPTVRSRCITHAMPWPHDDEAIAWLSTHGFNPSDAKHMLRFCGGRPLDAVALQSQGLTGEMLRDVVQSVQRGDLRLFTQVGPRITLDALQKLCHDLCRASSGAPPRYFEASLLPRPPGAKGLLSWAKSLNESVKSVDHPFNAGLMLQAMLQQAQAALNAKD